LRIHHPETIIAIIKCWISLRIRIVRSVSWIVIWFWWFWWWLTDNIMPLRKSINIICCCSVYPWIHSFWIYCWIFLFFSLLNERLLSFWRKFISWVRFFRNVILNEIVDIFINLLITNILLWSCFKLSKWFWLIVMILLPLHCDILSKIFISIHPSCEERLTLWNLL
jgi:hypothetical protein